MRFRIPAVAVAAALAYTPALTAQGVVVQSVSDVRFYGGLAKLVGFAARFGGGGDMHNIPTTTSISGHKLRTESRNSATIIDADAGRFTHIDLKDKTYYTMTFEEMAAAMKAAADSMQAAMDRSKAEQAKNPKSDKTTDVTVHYKASVDRTGQHQQIAGFDAERVFLTLSAEAEAKKEGEQAQQAGSIVFLFEEWLSKDAPQLAAMKEFQQAYAQKAGQAFRPPMEALSAAFATNPEIKSGFDDAAKELQKLNGVALRTVAYVVAVPANMQFDRQLALGEAAGDSAKPAEKKSRFGGMMGALKSAAEQKAGGGNAKSDQPKEADQPKQSTIMSVSDVVTNINKTDVPASVFAPPAGFREVPRPAKVPPR